MASFLGTLPVTCSAYRDSLLALSAALEQVRAAEQALDSARESRRAATAAMFRERTALLDAARGDIDLPYDFEWTGPQSPPAAAPPGPPPAPDPSTDSGVSESLRWYWPFGQRVRTSR